MRTVTPKAGTAFELARDHQKKIAGAHPLCGLGRVQGKRR